MCLCEQWFAGFCQKLFSLYNSKLKKLCLCGCEQLNAEPLPGPHRVPLEDLLGLEVLEAGRHEGGAHEEGLEVVARLLLPSTRLLLLLLRPVGEEVRENYLTSEKIGLLKIGRCIDGSCT